MINRMMKKAVKMQKNMMEIYKEEMPEEYDAMVNKDKPIFCQYCGAKNDRASSKCTNCNALLKN